MFLMTLVTWWFCWGNSNLFQMPLENIIWYLRVELYNSFFQHVKLTMPKRKLLLIYDSLIALLGVSLIMCLLYFFELSICVTSFVAEAIVAPFKYVGNKAAKICTRYTTLIFFILLFVTFIEYLPFINLLLCGDI